MKRFLIYLVAFLLNTSLLLAGIASPRQICLVQWDHVQKNDQGKGLFVVGGFVGIMYFDKDVWIEKCIDKAERDQTFPQQKDERVPRPHL